MPDTFDPVERENEIMETLEALSSKKLEFIAVGGYAVSAYRHRFSIDADIAIRKGDMAKFEEVLKSRGYRKSMEKRLENDYSHEYVRYEKASPKAFVDLLIEAVGVRQTGASFVYDFIAKNSSVKTIQGSEKVVKIRVAGRELLITMKIHSGRLTDMRDVAALAFGLDIEKIRSMIFRGDVKVLKKNMEKFGSLIEKLEFQDSFKGVFMEKNYRIDMEEIRKLLKLFK